MPTLQVSNHTITEHSNLNKYKIPFNQVRFAIFNLTSLGPSLWYVDPIIGTGKISTIREKIMEKFAVYSMVGVTQGSNYNDGLYVLPLLNYCNYGVLVLSLVYEELDDLETHERYFQVICVLPKKYLKVLPSVTKIEKAMINAIKSKVIIDCTELELIDMKYRFLDILNTFI